MAHQRKEVLKKLRRLGIPFDTIYEPVKWIVMTMEDLTRFHPPLEEKGYGDVLNAIFFGKRRRSQREWKAITEKHIFNYFPENARSLDDITTSIAYALHHLYPPRATLPWDSALVGEIDEIVGSLTHQYATVIRRRFGLSGCQKATAEALAEELHWTPEKVRYTEQNALRKLRSAKQKIPLDALKQTWADALRKLVEALEAEEARHRELRWEMLKTGDMHAALTAIGMKMPEIVRKANR